jgi:hypothetical protein
MQAFEPFQLERVAELSIRKRNRGRNSVEHFVLLTSISLIYLIMLVWFIARGGGDL